MLLVSSKTLLLAAAALLEPPAAPSGAPPSDCKAYGAGPCCDPAIAEHLPRRAIFAACRETAETYLGEKGGKDTCRHVFKAEGAAADSAYVEIYVQKYKQPPPSEPSDPFFTWAKVGKAFVTARARSPKSAPMLASSTGIWLPGADYSVSVNTSIKVCTRAEAQKLAKLVK